MASGVCADRCRVRSTVGPANAARSSRHATIPCSPREIGGALPSEGEDLRGIMTICSMPVLGMSNKLRIIDDLSKKEPLEKPC